MPVLRQNADGSWTPAMPIRKATWLEVLLDRWIGPMHGKPWLCVLQGVGLWFWNEPRFLVRFLTALGVLSLIAGGIWWLS